MRSLYFLILFFGFFSLRATAQTAAVAAPVIEFEGDTYDFGTVNQGEVVKHTFKFRNAGNADLVIQNVKPSCGCTTPTWTNEPVKPGRTGEIQVQFNSATRLGEQFKSITLTANTQPQQKVLILKGTVITTSVTPQSTQPVAGTTPTPAPATTAAPTGN
jgi:uncharacterized protein (DUF58 family)